ncbi:MAG: transposase [Prolixibacteraceae bacterium]|jgi:REP element-mobilizing transposase RayT|nr:transposase [Prolixibacteraceae bacterium]
MPEQRIPLEPNYFYHIYNRGINGCPIFHEITNYAHFLSIYDKYISPVADTYAWVLMGNHFHILVRIKTTPILNPQGFQNLEGLGIEKRINQQFSNLFNAYTKAFNKKYNRTGSLFEHTFKRKRIEDETYLKQTILYIHNNPVHHGFCEHPIEYPWSSYMTCISVRPTKLHREEVIGWFDNEANFKTIHNEQVDMNEIEEWLNL